MRKVTLLAVALSIGAAVLLYSAWTEPEPTRPTARAVAGCDGFMMNRFIEGPPHETPDEALASMLRASDKAPHDYEVTKRSPKQWIAQADDRLGTINLEVSRLPNGTWISNGYEQCQDGATS